MTISAEDKFEIQDAIVKIYEALDNHSGSNYASFFTPNGILENKSFGVITGREKIANFIQTHCEAGNENGATNYLTNAAQVEANSRIRQQRLGSAQPALTVMLTQTLESQWLLEIEAIAAAKA